MKTCLPCGRGLHDECTSQQQADIYLGEEFPCCCKASNVDVTEPEIIDPLGRREVGESAGRKEAARLYPLERDKPCEWQGLANVGGGHYPIVGCIAGLQENLHHGPVKNTTENARHNIHKICSKCHNTWHAKNDKVYDEATYAKLPHKPVPATPEELVRGNIGIKPEISAID